jgi:hypothetical protein
MMNTQKRIKTVLTLIAVLGIVAGFSGNLFAEEADIFSVNFYYKPWPWPDTDTHNITLNTYPEDADQSAGFGDWLTNGWNDIEIPWDPSGPQDPETITSKKGATATFTLTTARNGGSYSWDAVRTTLLGDGNGDMMDGHANGTEDADKLIEMTVSDIPFSIYDVIVYMGSQSSQFFDGTGKIVFNGVERDFTLTSGAFDGTFTQIVDATTPGNYLVYEAVSGSSFTVKVWGNGFNHIGPCGFQFVAGDPNLPSVDAGVNMVSWSGQAVQMDPNVVNNDTTEPQGELSYLWTASPDGIGDPDLDVAITGADQEDASVTITKTAPTGDVTVVRMTLAVTLEGKAPVKDSMTIDVYDDACAAALDLGLTTIDTTDLDGNCITAFPDFAVMATTWLDDYTLTEAAAKP